MKSEEKKSDIECTYCLKKFKYESEKKRHEESHTPRFQCKVCMKKFSFLSALRRHEKQHERVEDVQCSECKHKFRDEALLKRHMNYAHKGTFLCTKCSAKFNSEMALRTHLKTHKPLSERRFRCHFEGCNKSFNFQHHLKHHEMTHTNTKQYFCNACGKGFIQLHHLKTHMKTHTLERFPCTVDSCKKTFTNEYARRRHLATHSSTNDSGISSSDSNSGWDTSDLKEEEMLICSQQQFTKEQYKKHTDTSKKDLEHSVNSPITNLQGTSDKEAPQDLSVKSVKDVRIEIYDFQTCKDVLGGCIVSENGEADENCLCAQINSTVNDYNFIPNETPKLTSEFENNPGKDTITVLENDQSCNGCACNPKENVLSTPMENKSTNFNTCKKFRREMPELEYRIDGTIKIKETFDTDIDIVVNDPKVAEKKKIVKELPFNSCKSFLGQCIATGSGKISDDCLCAKMAFLDSVNVEEIEEITPQPMIRM